MLHTIPTCIGMPRSASRMTWQIVKELLPNDPPPGWSPVPELDVESYPHNIRTHLYCSGDSQVVYTYRHPAEAFLSLTSRYSTDTGKGVILPDGSKTAMDAQTAGSLAMMAIGGSWDVWKKLKQDAANGRDVLFLRYEDYYDGDKHKVEERIRDICTFIKADVTIERIAQIADYVSIGNNASRSLSVASDTFVSAEFDSNGIQKNHINTAIMGSPGGHLRQSPRFADELRSSKAPALSALREMCEDLGYEV